jgi:hypothetical protein
MKNPKKWYDDLSGKAKTITIVMGAITALGGGSGGVYAGYAGLAKKSSVDAIIVRLDKKDMKERIDFLERQVDKCKDKYGDDFSRATDPWDKENCRKWLRELKDKYKEFDQYYKG